MKNRLLAYALILVFGSLFLFTRPQSGGENAGAGFNNNFSGQAYVASSAFTAATTTLCGIVNSDSVARVIPIGVLDLNAGNASITANGTWRAYVAPTYAAVNPAATSTVIATRSVTSSTVPQTFGGATSTVLWPSGWYYNVTSSVITSSTGNCKVYYNQY